MKRSSNRVLFGFVALSLVGYALTLVQPAAGAAGLNLYWISLAPQIGFVVGMTGVIGAISAYLILDQAQK